MRRTISLLKHSTTKSSYDVIIMGGGAMGSSTAFHLSQMDPTMKILCIEKDFCYKINSAMLSAGGIRQQFSVPENIKMSMYGIEFLKNMKQLKVNDEIPNVQYHEIGYLFLAKGEHNKKALEDNHKVQLECGAYWLKTLDQEGLKKRFPWLNAEDILLGTMSDKNEGYFDPWSYVNSMKKKSISVGVDYIEGEVVNAKLEGSPSSPASSANITSIDVKLSNGEIQKVSGNTYVNATGAWGGKLVDMLAKNAPNPSGIAKLPVFRRKRNVFLVHCREKDHPIPPALTPLTVDPTGVYFRPEGQGGRYICGVSPAEGEKDPDCEDSALLCPDHDLFQNQIWPALAERVPAFEELKIQSAWAGFYEFNSLDQNGIIGKHSEIQNLLLCNGFSGHGLQQSPAAGRAISELIIYNKFNTLDLSRFGFERIVDNKPIFEVGIV